MYFTYIYIYIYIGKISYIVYRIYIYDIMGRTIVAITLLAGCLRMVCTGEHRNSGRG